LFQAKNFDSGSNALNYLNLDETVKQTIDSGVSRFNKLNPLFRFSKHCESPGSIALNCSNWDETVIEQLK